MSKFKVAFIGSSEINLEPHNRAIKLAGGVLERVDDSKKEKAFNELKNYNVIIVEQSQLPLNSDFFSNLQNSSCKGVVCIGHGYDSVDMKAATDNKIIFVNGASFGTEEVSNQTMMLLLVCARKFVLHDKLMKSGTWTREYLSPMGHISGETLGLIGIGDIGRAVSRKAKAFGMNVIGYDPYLSSWNFKEYGIEIATSIEEICEKSDYVSLHTNLTDETYQLVGEKHFKLMKKTAYLINCSRGPVVDELALIDALKSQEIAGAGLDVFEQEPIDPENPLLSMDNVATTNHYASYSELAWERAQTQLGEEAVRIATGTLPMSFINKELISEIPEMKQAQVWEIYKNNFNNS